ncbi:MAG TPA: aldehyde dehydrogenase (NADP(+)) [Pyrinomonadaceae bacterium]|nr:aldehyde dehydrogenase (NADP(+)) [Pyrinomonadaceae bacterium]
MKNLLGTSIIGFSRSQGGPVACQGFNPATGEDLLPVYHSASAAEVDQTAQLAHAAFAVYSQTTGSERARFLRRIAENIEALGDELITRANQETALPEPRLRTETGRTCNQLRMFAQLVEEGSWVDARIDHGDRERKPLPKPDARSMLRPLGPVVVFGASNFPLAFSVAGGDTASALAAGSPVIVKAHHAHPGTSELVGLAVSEAVRNCELPEGVFSLLFGSGNEVGTALVKHPLIKAGGFTGSRAGGRALFDAASSRPEPIPFYAEMSSVNPVVILPGALRERSDQIATGLHGSVTLGAGQFCTNPGLVFLEDNEDSAEFVKKLGELMTGTAEQTMLTPAIATSYQNGISSRTTHSAVQTAGASEQHASCGASATLFKTDADQFIANPELADELFGPSTLVITYRSEEQLLDVIRSLEGQLTATIHGSEEDLRANHDLIRLLETKAGRLVFNGFPTGVEVCHAMVHGGPYPATSDGRSTSVGTRAIFRFTRQVCFQDFPDTALPPELQEANPLGIWRMVDGELKRD